MKLIKRIEQIKAEIRHDFINFHPEAGFFECCGILYVQCDSALFAVYNQ